ncbi:MAG: cobalamin-binding protein [Cellvibrionales bacterium TMED148]|nr:cobalamin-binding protein [Porticoccaceae bacterium]RPG89967.1 MAG: cobalamin-binding protein [Cellvibrionales bacterium TMED148]
MFILIVILFYFLFEPASASVLSAIDDSGSKITLESPVERIISMSPDLTEVVFELGAGPKLVGADEHSNHPPEARAITRVNSSSTANLELILSLEPDFILAWKTGNGPRVISRLRDLGLPVFVVETKRVMDVPALYRRLGPLFGQTLLAKQKAKTFSHEIEVIRQNAHNQPEITVFYEIWEDPLMTLSGKHMVSDAISICGGKNIFEDMVPVAPLISLEAVVAADPQVIVTSGSVEGLQNWRSRWSRWAGMQAVKNQHLYMVAPDLLLRQSGRLLEGVKSLCDKIQKARSLT